MQTGPPRVADSLRPVLDVTVPRSGDGEALESIREELESAAARAAELVEGHGVADGPPLRLPKRRVAALGACERHAVAVAAAEAAGRGSFAAGSSIGMLAGRALDVFVGHEIAVGPVADPLEDLLSWLDACGELDVRDEVIAAGADLQLAPLAAAARSWSGLDPMWWPRTQAAAALHLAGGRVRCEGRTDVELGGPLTGVPSVVVEVKLGRPTHGHLAEVTHYALLVALRDRTVPAAVARWYPGGALATMPVTLDVLHAAARRLSDAIGAWAELQVGRPPAERAGPVCRWCPDADRCPSFEAPPDPLDDGGDR